MRNATLLFLVKKDNSVISEVCLAMKKRGFGVGRYNGAGGKVEEGETIEQAVVREAKEEIGVTVKENSLVKVAELSFSFPHKEAWNQKVHTYITDTWGGEVRESEEMKPEWFPVGDIPYATMWPDDIYWLPKVLEGVRVEASFSFGEGDVILDQKVTIL